MSLRPIGLLLFATTACGAPDNWLAGSIDKDFSLEFEKVVIEKRGCTARIDYVKTQPYGISVPCRLEVDTKKAGELLGKTLGSGDTLDGQVFLDSVSVARVALVGLDFSEVLAGSLFLERFKLRRGAEVKGTFEVKFDGGRDLEGGFFEDSLRDPVPDQECR